jgi:hypothetical protein
MYAHRWALCCLIPVISFPAIAAETGVAIILEHADRLSNEMLGAMKSELSFRIAETGYQVHWSDPQASTSAADGDLVVVDLRGSCESPSRPDSRPVVVQLGSSAVVDGKVLPFTWVDCTQLVRVLEPHLTPAQREQRDSIYGRAMARVLAHEFYHVLRHTLVHTARGLTKARLAPTDLLSERAEFGNIAMAHSQDSARSALLVRTAAHP